jgi:FkbM family methyltransferase
MEQKGDMKKVFLDCGANKGESVRLFRERFADATEYEIFCFEPHEESKEDLDGLGVTVIAKAVWVRDGTVNFYPARRSTAGSTLLKDKTTWSVSKTPVEVLSLDFSAWMAQEFSAADHIVLKMNIEGAEYEVLEKMLADGTLAMVNRLYVSFHYQKIPSITKKRHQKLVEDIGSAGHKILNWWKGARIPAM